LILAIGAQNAFVLRQGLIPAHVFWLCLFCAVSDAILISAGVLGFGKIVTLWPSFPFIMALAGAAFLIFYGLTRLYAAAKSDAQMVLGQDGGSLKKVLLTAFAFTWLNPHVYLDTLGLIGAISTQYTDNTLRLAFGIGAVTSSFVFFFSLGYGARLLAPVMTSARAWKVLDAVIGVVMLILAALLLQHAFGSAHP